MASAVTQNLKHREYREDEFALWDGQLAVTDRVSDEILAGSYMRLKAEGLMESLFYEGVPSLLWFVENFSKNGGVEVLGLFRKEPDGNLTHCGLGWLNIRRSVSGVFDKMEVGFAFFSDCHDLKTTVTGTRLMIEFAFRFLGIESMFGTTPEHNRGALAVARRVGFKMCGPIPHYTVWNGEPCGVYISAMSKDRWQKIKEQEGY